VTLHDSDNTHGLDRPDNPLSNPAGLHPVIDAPAKKRPGRPKKETAGAMSQAALRAARAGALLAEVAADLGWSAIREIAESME
jgi:hypothetical protein